MAAAAAGEAFCAYDEMRVLAIFSLTLRRCARVEQVVHNKHLQDDAQITIICLIILVFGIHFVFIYTHTQKRRRRRRTQHRIRT